MISSNIKSFTTLIYVPFIPEDLVSTTPALSSFLSAFTTTDLVIPNLSAILLATKTPSLPSNSSKIWITALCSVRRRLHERKFAHVAELERNGAQNDGGQIGAQNFRIRKGGTPREVLLAVEANADAVGHAAASARALIGRSLAHGFYLKLLDLVAVGIALDAGLLKSNVVYGRKIL